MRILGFDPGVKNFAYAVYETDTETVTHWGWVRGVDVGDNDLVFLNSVLHILHVHKPDFVGIERFAFRREASVESEPINLMIGKLHLLVRMKGYDSVLIMPAHWKVKFHTKELKRGAKDLFPDTVFEAIHQADAAGIAKYVYEARRDRLAAAEAKAERVTARAEKKAAVAASKAASAKAPRSRTKLVDASVSVHSVPAEAE